MNMMKNMNELYKLQKDAKKLQKDLEQTHIVAEDFGAKVTVSGKLEVIDIAFDDSFDFSDREAVAKTLKELTNRAIKKTQDYMQEKMAPMMGALQGMGFGGQ